MAVANRSEQYPRQAWVPEPEGRGTIQLLWSSLFTLFICLWTSLHLNLPAKDDCQTLRLLRKMKWTAIAAIAPEVVLTMAYAQWWASRRDTKKMHQFGVHNWTQVHSFYANMGGLRIRGDHCSIPAGDESLNSYRCPEETIVDAHICQHHFRFDELSPAHIPTEMSITDKSKADGFVKLVACTQATWLVTQYIGRAIQHLPITTLELSCTAYVLYALVVYVLWWKKPLDVLTPTIIPFNDKPPIGYHRHPYPYYDSSLLGGSINQPYEKKRRGDMRIPNDCSHGFNVRAAQFPLIICCFVFGGIHCIRWNFSFPTQAEKLLWQVSCLLSMFVLPPITLIMYLFDWFRIINQYRDQYPRVPDWVRKFRKEVTS
jgi:hypothetical protein